MRRHSSVTTSHTKTSTVDKLIQIFTVSLLLSGWWTLMSEARPMSRTKRTALSQLINTNKIRNPCGVQSTDIGNAASCNTGETLRTFAHLAKDSLNTLQSNLGTSSICEGMRLDMQIPIPAITNDMTRVNKLREIYKSVVHHAAVIQAIASQQQEGSNLIEALQSSISSLQNVQCSLQCSVEMSASELNEVATSAESMDFSTNQNSSAKTFRTCLVNSSAITVLDQLIANSQD